MELNDTLAAREETIFVLEEDVKEKRNETGEQYLPCEYCKSDGMTTIVYITSYGNRYHTTAKCQGLKRTVIKIPFSQIEEETPCKKCG